MTRGREERWAAGRTAAPHPARPALHVVLLAALLLGGCGIYTFSGSIPGGMKTIAVPPFENQTAEFGLVEDLTDELIDRFIKDGTLKVKDLRDAESALYGTIVRVDDVPFTIRPDESVEEYKVTITVVIRFEDLVHGKVLWEERMSQFGVYPFSGGSSAQREEGLQEAVKKLTDDILNKTVSGW